MIQGAIFGGIAGGLVGLLIVLIRKPPKCEACGALQPKFRKPANSRQAMLGGYTCAGCGADLDARGKVRKPKT